MPSFKIVAVGGKLTVQDNTDYTPRPAVGGVMPRKEPPRNGEGLEGQPREAPAVAAVKPPPVEELAPAIESLKCEHCSFVASSKAGFLSHVRAKH